MSRIISLGEQSFQALIQENYFYIDKTKFIKDWWLGGDRVTLITRPRRFGKTLMLDTVKTFFSPKFAGRYDLFEGLEIWKDEKFRQLQGTIPVIFLYLAKIKNVNYVQTIENIKDSLTTIYKRFKANLNLSLLSDDDQELFTSVHKSMSDVTAQNALLNLSEFIERYLKNKPIILINEYATPLQEAWLKTSGMISVISCVFFSMLHLRVIHI